jgi:hypothetical protein
MEAGMAKYLTPPTTREWHGSIDSIASLVRHAESAALNESRENELKSAQEADELRAEVESLHKQLDVAQLQDSDDLKAALAGNTKLVMLNACIQHQLDSCITENAKLKEDFKKADSAFMAACTVQGIDKFRGESAELRERLASALRLLDAETQIEAELNLLKLKEDAERLDYIQSNARCDPKIDGNHVWWPTSFNHRMAGATLRKAIDKAMKEQKK